MKMRRYCLMLIMAALAATGSLGVAGCSGGVVVCADGAGPGCADPGPPLPPPVPFRQSSIDKLDVVLMIDNSRSMADKQRILADSVPALVRELANPPCVDEVEVPAAQQPQGPLEECPQGTRRVIAPVLDIHIGIVTSSLGGHGSDGCAVQGDNSCGNGVNPSNNDAGHLISRQAACGGSFVPTYESRGFLAWDPTQKLTPPGEKNLGDAMSSGIVPALRDMVIGAGQIGCGYESQLESWYRFLVDPEPYQTITVQNGKATAAGIDDLLLKQRADFLRPSSLLAIFMLTDENDCSMKEYGQFYFAAQQRLPSDPKQTFHLPRARAECAKNPNDPCCKSCGQGAGTCPADPTCAASPTLSALEDDINLRCWDNKRRFGIDFLYSVDRYAQALTSTTVPNRQGDLVPNPLFTDLNPSDDDSNVRDPSLVWLAGIVGVPWQLIARDPADLKKGFKSSDELSMRDPNGDSTWDRILGDPTSYIPPKDPHMIESVTPRAGLPAPGSAPDADPKHGHEFSIPNKDDLQYACVFNLPQPRDCSDPKVLSCDCGDPANDNPLCDPVTKTTQLRAKAYPGTRELATLRSLGPQGIVASICPAQVSDPSAADFGYRPAIGALIDRLKVAIDGKCLPRTLTPDKNGEVPCVVLEARNSHGMCSCDADRLAVAPEHLAVVASAKASALAKTAAWDCFCEIPQAGDPAHSTPEELNACQLELSTSPVIMGGKDSGKIAGGYCYIDATTSPSTGNPELVKNCPATQKRILRFVGGGVPRPEATVFVQCAGD